MFESIDVQDNFGVSVQRNAQEDYHVKGKIKITHMRDGAVLAEDLVDNLITTVGKNWIAARQKDTGQPTQLTHMACGTGTAAAAVGDTTLATELTRVALTTAGGTVSANVVTYTATFGPGVGTGALTEIGLFNASSAGTMVSRAVFSVKNKDAGDTITFTWTHTAS